MKKQFLEKAFPLCLAGMMLAWGSPTAWPQSRELTPEGLTRGSDLVAVGKVKDMKCEWTAEKKSIVTRVTVTVNEYLKGTSGLTLTVLVPGGEIDGVGEWYSHTPRFRKDEDVVLFAKKHGPAEYQVTGGENGKVVIMKDPETGVATVAGGVTLEAFRKRIKATPSQ